MNIAIQKMTLIEIVGAMSSLDPVLATCCHSQVFHIATPKEHLGFTPLREDNPYVENFRRAQEVMSDLSLSTEDQRDDDLDLDQTQIKKYLEQLKFDIAEIKKYRLLLRERIANHQMTLVQVKHLVGLDLCINDIIDSENTTVRFGKLPVDNYQKLKYFDDRSFFFFDFDHDDYYYWGFYVAPNNILESIDRIFDSLYYEQIDVSEYAHATPHEAIDALEEQIAIEEKAIANSTQELQLFREKHQHQVTQIHQRLSMLHEIFSYRKYATAAKNRFCLQGFVPTNQVQAFIDSCVNVDQIVCEQIDIFPHMKKTPPVKLKTNWFFRPFEMLVTMYGLPHYGGFDPTAFVGAIFVLLFGIMLGDFGQGAGIILAGVLIARYKKMQIGDILVRCGISSMFFGLVYGSFFGIEGSFSTFWDKLSLGWIFPLHVLEADTSMKLLLSSLVLGIVIILTSMMLNVVLRLRQNDIAGAAFSSNGVAGIVFYAGLIAVLLLTLLFQVQIAQPIFVIVLLLIPLVLMFFREPLEHHINVKKSKQSSDQVGTLEKAEKTGLTDTIFEMVEILLSYCTNTLSFLRVSGFVLSHAALMLVVLVFAEMAGSVGGVFVMIAGNIFVMLLKGLLVAIQVLRLVYYEVFSRFYDSGGEAYQPIQLQYETPSRT